MKALDYLMNNFQPWKIQLSTGLLTVVLVLTMIFGDTPSLIWDYILGFSAGIIGSLFFYSFTYKPIEE